VLVLGGDGYLGWPTALRFSGRGHEVALIDNLSRRHYHHEQGTDSLTPIASLRERVATWEQLTGRRIDSHVGDLTQWERVRSLVAAFGPDCIIHYGEQPSAPWSMKDREHAVSTQVNNLVGTLNVLFAMRDHAPDCHLIKLGTMGEYGTPNIDIEEGFLDVHHNGRRDRLPFPKMPGSFYHLSKVHDSHNIMFACRAWGVRCTDLNQGVVYGLHTEETACDERLVTRFDYDECFGTALNRFCVQAVIGHPLTVYGKGGQTRGFLNIQDTLQCVELASQHPPGPGQYHVLNQFTEQFSVRQLAELVVRAGARIGLPVEIVPIRDPRVELEEHYYNARHSRLLELGLRPHYLSEEFLESMLCAVRRHQHRVIADAIVPRIRWRP
jgi:UDP-sulfoquinovose synthase